jgi:hypothetical protein
MSDHDGHDDLEIQHRIDLARRAQANRPGLASIDYRIGTYPTFLERMLERVHRQTVPPKTGSEPPRPLQNLHARDSDDPAIAMLDAWATVADVLTFYQERIANEHYMRTALEHRSVTELARLIGYEPDPGVAASARLAFSVDDSPQGPRVAEVPAGTQVQSVPEKGELPQTFETDSDFQARPEWNALEPRLDRPQYLAVAADTQGKKKLYMVDSDGTLGADPTGGSAGATKKLLNELHFVGPDLPLAPGEDLQDLGTREVRVQEVNVFYLDGIHDDLRRGDPILLVGTPLGALPVPTSGKTGSDHLLRRLISVKTEPEKGRTAVQVGVFPTSETPVLAENAQAYVTMTATFREADLPARMQTANAQTTFKAVQTKSNLEFKRYAMVHNVGMIEATAVAASSGADQQKHAPDAERGVVLFDRSVGFFGSNAPNHTAVAKASPDAFEDNWDDAEYKIWNKYTPDAATTSARTSYRTHGRYDVYLERVVDQVEVSDWVVFTGGSETDHSEMVYRVVNAAERSMTGFSLSTRTTGLELTQASGEGGPDKKEFGIRSSTAFVGNRKMALAQVPMSAGVGSLSDGPQATVVGATSLALDGVYLNFAPEQEVIIGGERLDAGGLVAYEVARLTAVDYAGAHTILRFSSALTYAYRRETVVVHANLVRATHGESLSEVLGSGDASQKNQSFVLSKPPLTYVPSSGGTGSTSTLAVRVDGVLWPQVDSLNELGSDDQGYVVRIDERDRTRLTFGDGHHGAKLPSGRENVVATYRSGIGLVGEVGPDRLTLLKKRPAGIRKVTNPVAASDASDPESRDDTRANAPRDTRLLDRVVSLQDYADFARNYGGVGKARADLISHAGHTAVHLTVGGTSAEGARLGAERQADLARSITEVSSTRYRVEVRSLEVAFFGVEAAVAVDGRYIAEQVLAAVRARLERAYSYEARGFSEPVSASAVIASIQGVDGVEAVFLKALYAFDGQTAGGQTAGGQTGAGQTGAGQTGAGQTSLERVLTPRGTRSGASGEIQAAQLLFIDSDAIELSEA